jgi:hypothetical protein
MADEKTTLIKLTGLWTGKAGGKTYLCGNMTPTSRLLIFKNGHKKTGSKEPDYYAYLAANKPKEKTADSETGEL